MQFLTRIQLNNIRLTRFTSTAAQDFAKDSGLNLLLTDPKESSNKSCMSLCTRLEHFELRDYSKEDHTGCLVYDESNVGTTPTNRPAWFKLARGRMIETRGEHNYGLGQGLRVAESLVYRSAEARIRCEPMTGSHGVHTVKILARGRCSLGDALWLHARILSGEAYK